MIFSSAVSLLSPFLDFTARRGRVLWALTPREWEIFFPNDAGLGASDEKWFSDGGESFEVTLQRFSPEVLVTSWSTPPLPEDWLWKMPDLRYICHTSGAVRRIIPRSFLEGGGLVTNWGPIAAQSVAEHALLLILAGLRRQPEWPPIIAGRGPWHLPSVPTRTFHGKRLGIHGFGNVARALIPLCRPFGVAIAAFTTGVSKEDYDKFGVVRCQTLEELFETSEVLVECEALTAATQGIVTRRLLQHLPQGALFVNVGRGAIADEQALADLAQSGYLDLALDVFSTDPIAPNSPLHAVKGAILSPHIAGPTADQFPRCGEAVKKNLQAFFNGQPLESVVTLEMYDRIT